MDRRLKLHDALESIMTNNGHNPLNVHFQPPDGTKLQYPAIVYKRDYIDTKFGDNSPYSTRRRYQITFIARDPDESTVGDLERFPMTVYDRFFKSDGLNHDVFKTYF